MTKAVKIICLSLIVLFFACMFVFTVFFQHTYESDYNTLSEWPKFSAESFFSGEYFSGIMYWFTDHVPGRDRFIDYEARVRALYGINQDEDVYIRDTTPNEPSDSEISDTSDISQSSPTDTSEGSYENEFSTVSFDENDNSVAEFSQGEAPTGGDEICEGILILDSDKRGMEIFYGNLGNCEKFAQALNELSEKLPDGVTLYSMVVPKASAYYIWQSAKYAKTANNNKNNIDRISETLNDKVVDVNVYNTLGMHADEAIFFRTDHHWTALGAYYASEVFAEKAGVPFADLSSFTEVSRPGYVGTLYKYSGYNIKLKDNPEDFVYYVPKADYTAEYGGKADFSALKPHDGGLFWKIDDSKVSSWYATFILGDTYSVKVKSNVCHNGRKLLLIKDSYGNALSQYLVEGFEEIYIVDSRYYQRSILETVEDYGITDILIAECTFSAVSQSYINKLKELSK